jgi:NADPH:quinone reductase-like Zn-dependent oxidoreductase
MSDEMNLHGSDSNSITILPYTRPASGTQLTARERFAISSRQRSAHREEQEMKAIRCREWGTPDVLRLEEAESPSLKSHHVRIRVRAAGVNFADSLMVGGTYQVKPPFPFTPGLEAAGEIVETGSTVDGLQIGQRVLAVLRNGGGYAEEIVLDAAAVVPIPDAMDFVTAAAFPVAYGTSHFALTHRGQLQRGETLLVLGAAGGVGLTAVEIGKAMGGARHRRGWRRRKTGGGDRAGRRRADRLSTREHPRPGARADRWQRCGCRLRPGRR